MKFGSVGVYVGFVVVICDEWEGEFKRFDDIFWVFIKRCIFVVRWVCC